MAVTPVHYSSASVEWPTPQRFYNALNAEFNFTLDVAATHDNAKCPVYFTEADDGLSQDWVGMARGGAVWMNPPYKRPEYPCKPNCTKKKCAERGHHITEYQPGLIDWIRKAYEESQRGATVVCLIPSRTDTEMFHDYIFGKAELRFVRGRLKFGSANNVAPFPSLVVVYRPNEEGADVCRAISA